MDKLIASSFLAAMLPVTAFAQTSLAEAMAMVRATCQTAQDAGSFSGLTAKGQVEGNIRVKLIGKAGADAYVEYTEQEWTSLQQVMVEDQLEDNISYRNCVTTLTPSVLDKMP
ncbi:MAG: hypothetical protein AAF822_14585 [Pseudomonadota bacterium]